MKVANRPTLAGVKIKSQTRDLVVPHVLMHVAGHKQEPLTCGCSVFAAPSTTNVRIRLDICCHSESVNSYPVVQVHLGNVLALSKRVISDEAFIIHGMCWLWVGMDWAPTFSIT